MYLLMTEFVNFKGYNFILKLHQGINMESEKILNYDLLLIFLIMVFEVMLGETSLDAPIPLVLIYIGPICLYYDWFLDLEQGTIGFWLSLIFAFKYFFEVLEKYHWLTLILIVTIMLICVAYLCYYSYEIICRFIINLFSVKSSKK